MLTTTTTLVGEKKQICDSQSTAYHLCYCVSQRETSQIASVTLSPSKIKAKSKKSGGQDTFAKTFNMQNITT